MHPYSSTLSPVLSPYTVLEPYPLKSHAVIDANIDAILTFLSLPYAKKKAEIQSVNARLHAIQEYNPDHPVLALCLGEIALLQQDEVQALSHFQKLISSISYYELVENFSSEYPFVFSRVGFYYLFRNLLEEADVYVQEGFKYIPSDPITVFSQCAIYKQTLSATGRQEYRSLIETRLKTLYEQYPQDPFVVYCYVSYHLANDTLSPRELLSLLTKAFEEHPDHIGLAFLLGEFFFKNEQSTALEYYEKAISSPMALKNPQGQMALVRRAALYAHTNPDQASQDLLTVMTESSYSDVLFEASLVVKKHANHLDVQALYNRIHQIHPHHPALFLDLSQKALTGKKQERDRAVTLLWESIHISLPQEVRQEGNKEKKQLTLNKVDILDCESKKGLLDVFVEKAIETKKLPIVKQVYTKLKETKQVTPADLDRFLTTAVRHGSFQIVRFFLDLHDESLPQDPETGGSLLFSVVGAPHCTLEVLQELLKIPKLAHLVSEKNREGKTVADWALMHGHFGAAKILMQAGAKASPVGHTVTAQDIHYLDPHHLLKGARGSIEPIHLQWHLQQGFFLEHMRHLDIDEETKARIGLALINAYSKGGPFKKKSLATLPIQTSPIQDGIYFREADNPVSNHVNSAYAKMVGLEAGAVKVMQSSLFVQLLRRKFEIRALNTLADIKEYIEQLVHLHENKAELVDFSLCCTHSGDVQSITQAIRDLIHEVWRTVTQKLSAEKLQVLQEHLSNVQFFAIIPFKQYSLCLLPDCFQGIIPKKNWERFSHDVSDMLHKSGFCLSLLGLKSAWLAIDSPETILTSFDVPVAERATAGLSIPQVCKDLDHFLSQPVVGKFKNIRSSKPYVSLLSAPTCCLLEGLKPFDIDRQYKERNSTDLLQLSYFRILQAMNQAIHCKEKAMAFITEIEIIHQEIQNILTIIQPYATSDFERVMMQRFKEKIAPDFPLKNCAVQFYLAPVGMRAISNVILGCEAEKENKQLTTAVLSYHYYETVILLEASKNTQVHMFDGASYLQMPEDASAEEKVKRAFGALPTTPIDLFICEFHHNISETIRHYFPEKIAEYVKAMAKIPGLLADKCTIMVDCTIGLECGQNSDLSQMLEDETIQEMVQKGRLNLLFARSAQKFDLLGMDNYSGGITISLNNPEVFKRFNDSMNHPDHQEKGVSLQGITHLMTHAQDHLDKYRRAMIRNTQKLYSMLPKELIYSPSNTRSAQIALIEDPLAVFLDIGSTNALELEKVHNAWLPETSVRERQSFGFPMLTIMTLWSETKGMHKIRFNIGLEDDETLTKYASIFANPTAFPIRKT